MKKNNKGFTLIELLAVIVVLAIIMVIATTQINNTIKKSRADSFYESVQMIERNAKLLCAQDNEINANDLYEISDMSTDDEDYTITVNSNTNNSDISTVTVTAKTGGQFDNVTFTEYYCTKGTEGCSVKKADSGITVNAGSMQFNAECKISSN